MVFAIVLAAAALIGWGLMVSDRPEPRRVRVRVRDQQPRRRR